MVLCISSITGTIVTISLPVASVIDTIIATMLATSCLLYTSDAADIYSV